MHRTVTAEQALDILVNALSVLPLEHGGQAWVMGCVPIDILHTVAEADADSEDTEDDDPAEDAEE